MNRFEFVVNEKIYRIETQDDVLKVISFILEDETITIIDNKACRVQTHYGDWLLEKILNWLKLSASLTVVKFNNIMEGVLYETDTTQ